MYVGSLGGGVNNRFFLFVILGAQRMVTYVNSCLLDCVVVDIQRTVLLTDRLL